MLIVTVKKNFMDDIYCILLCCGCSPDLLHVVLDVEGRAELGGVGVAFSQRGHLCVPLPQLLPLHHPHIALTHLGRGGGGRGGRCIALHATTCTCVYSCYVHVLCLKLCNSSVLYTTIA